MEQVKALLAVGDVAAVISSAVPILSSAGLVARFESAALHDAMRDKAAAQTFYEALFRLLEAPEPDGEAFDSYAATLAGLPAERGRVATWPNATAPLYLAQPERFLFLKPEVTRAAAEALAFDLHYEPQVNWTTYSALLRMGSIYLELLRPMGARDLIDVQTFIFVIGGGYD